MALQILSTKLHAPGVSSAHVPRSRLEALLERGVRSKLTLLSAPAGFGKSALLASWAQGHSASRIAWLHLDPADNDLSRFLTYLISALQPHCEQLEDLLHALDSTPPPPAEALLTALINAIGETEEGLVLLLDDYHVIDSALVHEALGFLLEHLPNSLCIFISTRVDPPLPLHKLRAQGSMTEIRSEHLRFDRDETGRFLTTTLAQPLSLTELDTVQERVEGWVAGLQMLALSLHGKQDVGDFIENFGGSNRFVLDYLTEEVFNIQDPSIQQFLLQSSVLEQLCGPLCDYVVAIDGLASENPRFSTSQEVLEHLEQSNLFTLPMDDERVWYRYHHLFAELLRQRLRQHSPEATTKLQRRASDWYAANGFPDEAFQYALAAKDYAAAAQIVESQGYDLLRTGSLSTLMGWFNRLPPDLVRGSVELSIILAWVLLLTAQTVDVDEILSAAEAAEIGEEVPGTLHAEIAAIRAYAAARRADVRTAMEQSEKALALLPQDNYTLRSVVFFVLGGLYFLEGATEKALDAWRDASVYGERSGNIHLAVSALNSMAGILTETGKTIEAEEIYTRALELGTSPSGRPLSSTASIYSGLARIHLARRDLQKAREHAQIGFELAQQWLNPDSKISSLLTLAHVAQLEGDPDGAQQMLDEVTRIASTRTLTPGTEVNIERAKSQITSLNAEEDPANSLLEPLSDRELDVLRLIDKGHTNPEIAELLIIAIGTVKAHTSSIYGKLGVSNRTQAVLRARELGIM